MSETDQPIPTPEEGLPLHEPSPQPAAPEFFTSSDASASAPLEPSPAETAPDKADTEPATTPGEPTGDPSPEEPPVTAYRWVYEEQAAHDAAAGRRRRGRNGVLVYSLVMTGFFLISFALLIAVLWVGSSGAGIGSIQRPGITPGDTDEAVVGVEQAKHSVVVIEVKTATGGGTGTGIILTEDGYIATNHHVIEGATEVRVTFYDGTATSAEIVGSSEMDDLAVVKVSRTGLTAATFARSEDCYVGETVYAIGTPAGPEFAWTTTKGIISYKDREVKIYDDLDGTLQKKLRLIQTDANVNPGNSGGPLINTKGEVVGVVSMKLAEGYEGMGFAIPADGAVEILEAIMEYGNADSINSSVSHKRPMLGILCIAVEGGKYYVRDGDRLPEITEDMLGQFDEAEIIHPAVSGVLVMGITEGMDAVGKLREGDIITAVQGIEILTGDELSAVINDYYAGDTVTITVYRGTIYTPVDIVLSAQTSAE